MSYILDALRRADAERQRGNVPGLHALAVPATSADAAAPRRVVPLAWVLGGAALLLGGAALLWLLAADRRAEPAALTALPAAPTAPAALLATPATTAPLSAPTSLVLPPVALPAAAPRPAVAAPPRPLPVSDAASTAAADAAAASAAASAAAGRVPQWTELPDTLRAQMPAITLGGGVYAEQAAQRLVLINGQVAREGDSLTAELQLLRILPRSVILSFRGQPFEMKL